MDDILNIETIEQLQPFINNDNIMEIVMRGRNSKFKAFQKVVLNGIEQSEAKKTAEKIRRSSKRTRLFNWTYECKERNFVFDKSIESQIDWVIWKRLAMMS